MVGFERAQEGTVLAEHIAFLEVPFGFFETPVLQFGGYLGIVNEASGGNVTFFDENDAIIDTLPLDLPFAEWAWCGWDSDTPVARVEVHANANPGVTTVFDDMQVNFVPEPGALGLIAVGAAVLLRRRS